MIGGVLTRRALLQHGPERLARGVRALKPWSMVGLLATVVLLFGFQAGTLVAQPLVIAMIAVPLVLQSYGIFFVSAIAARWLGLPHEIAAPACLIETSNSSSSPSPWPFRCSVSVRARRSLPSSACSSRCR